MAEPSADGNGRGQRPPKPPPMPVDAAGIPDGLKTLRRWVCWRWTWNGRKWDKPPLTTDGRNASSTDPTTWTDFDTAFAAYRTRGYDGIGIALGELGDGTNLVGMDLDHHRNPETGDLTDLSRYVIVRLSTYAEVSPSRRGLKLLAYGGLPESKADRDRGIEMYAGGRYFTVTGNRVPGTTADVCARGEELHRLQGELFPKAANDSGQSLTDRELALSALAGLGSQRAVGYADWLAVGMALHSVGNDGEMLAAWDQWSRSCPEKYVEGACERKWKGFGRKTGLKLGSLIHWAKQDGWRPPESNPNNGRRQRTTQQTTAAEAFRIGRLTLRPQSPRRTPTGKLTLTVSAFRDGHQIDEFPFNGSASGREKFTAWVRHLGAEDDATLEEVVRKLVVSCSQAADAAPPAKAESELLEVVRRVVPVKLGIKAKDDGRLWSETHRRFLNRQEFIALTPTSLLQEAVRVCPDAGGDLLAAQAHVERALKALFADLLDTLPFFADADMGGDTAAAARFVQDLIRLWTATDTWEKSTKPDDVVRRASLIHRAKEQFGGLGTSYVLQDRESWREVLSSAAAWWRPHEKDDGELVLMLAMRFELCTQWKVIPLGAMDHPTLVAVGSKWGAFEPHPPVSKRLGGGTRVAVLSRELTDRLLKSPDEDDEPVSVTAEGGCH